MQIGIIIIIFYKNFKIITQSLLFFNLIFFHPLFEFLIFFPNFKFWF